MLNVLPALPEIFVLAMACVILLVGLWIKRIPSISYYLAQLTLIAALILTWIAFSYYDHGLNVLTFNNTFILDRLAFVLKMAVIVAVLVCFIYSRHYNQDHFIPANEFYVLGLLSTLGMMTLVSAYNFLTLFLGMELLSLPIYAMIALQRGKERSIEAGIKYFVVGALGLGMMLYGMTLIFAVTKNLEVVQIAQLVQNLFYGNQLIILTGLIFIIAGIAFKFGAAPFHMWVPDVYDGSPTSATLFLSTAPKLAAFALAIRLLDAALPSLSVSWGEVLIVIAILSMAIGNFIAIAQSNIKRLLAYSSIAHMGYMILGLCAGRWGYAAALFYVITYALMTLGSFGLIALLGRMGFEANEIEDFAGLNNRNPWLAFMMMLLMFSLAGVPPLVGFIAKLGIIEALIDAHLVWLAVLAVLFSIVGAYYYIRVVKVMYFERAQGEAPPFVYPLDTKIAITVNGLAVLALGIFPDGLFTLCHFVFH